MTPPNEFAFIVDSATATPASIIFVALGILSLVVCIWKSMTDFSSLWVPCGFIGFAVLISAGFIIGHGTVSEDYADDAETWIAQTYGIDVEVNGTDLTGLRNGKSMTVVGDGHAYDLIMSDDKLVLANKDGTEVEQLN